MAYFRQACQDGWEGLIAKRVDAPYRAGRSKDWLKFKCEAGQELVIGGYTDPRGSRSGFGALLLGYYDPQRRLTYAGKVGTGFDDQTLHSLHDELTRLERKDPPFERGNLPRPAGVHWVEPRLVAEVGFSEWTTDGLLRHPRFQGLRRDKPPDERRAGNRVSGGHPAAATVTVGGITVELSHTGKVFYPDDQITKGDVVEYYLAVADRMLPYLRDRPLTMARYPDGITGHRIIQKNVPDYFPDWITRAEISKQDGTVRHVICDKPATLAYLANQACIEPHVFLSRVNRPDRPDQLVFDLDPPAGGSFEAPRQAALWLRSLLEGELGVTPFVKTTGGKGLHVLVPLSRREGFDEVRGFASAAAAVLAARHPDAVTTEQRKDKRGGQAVPGRDAQRLRADGGRALRGPGPSRGGRGHAAALG